MFVFVDEEDPFLEARRQLEAARLVLRGQLLGVGGLELLLLQ